VGHAWGGTVRGTRMAQAPGCASPAPECGDWHVRSVAESLDAFTSTKVGLDSAEASTRLEEFGPNSLPEQEVRKISAMVLDQFKDFLILLLIGAAIISGLLGETVDTIAILVIVVLNAVIGVVQEYRAERAMDALRKMAAASATVRREGRVIEVPADELVPGDVVLLDAGRVIPADLRVIESARLRIAEATLTGESLPVEKGVEPVPSVDAPLGDRTSMAYKGTQVVYGRGEGLVVATGMQTEFGRIAGLLQSADGGQTPLQKRLATFGRQLGLAAIGLTVFVLVAGLLRGDDPLLMLLIAISLAVAAVPEALPAVATITLALGASRMAQSNALVRRLPAVETLGSVTYICTDKTGTLTLNRMRAERFMVPGITLNQADGGKGPAWEPYWRAMALCSDATVSEDAEDGASGDPTETALYAAAALAGATREAVESSWPRIAELPFDSERKLMTTFHKSPDGRVVSLSKGAAERIIAQSKVQLRSGSMTPIERDELFVDANEISGDGLRVLAYAMREFDELPADLASVEEDMCFLGLVGLMDPPRIEASQAVAECISAGIVPVMITGDHPATAMAIARQIGIAHEETEVVTGQELEGMSLDQLERRVSGIRVYARVAPEQKLKIVSALQNIGEFVSMTGDGVNDAPALKQADIGVAMGITGTDVAKEASSMILLDDNFATIIHAVKEGRRIYDNILKFITYTLSSNVGEIITVLIAPFLGMPIPLLPIHILWINLVTDGLPGLAYASEPAEIGTMSRPPRPPRQSPFADGRAIRMLWIGGLLGAVTLATQAIAMDLGFPHWRSMVFTVLCFGQLGNALALRSETQSVFRQGLLSNKPMTGALLLTVVLQLATLYVPFLNPVFRTAPLSLAELGVTALASVLVFGAVEIQKWVSRRATERSDG
jgi:Ca2+-transporting ATPase